MAINYILDNIVCNPVEKENIGYKFDFTDRLVRELELDVDELTFVREDFKRIKQWISNYGYYVGMPLKIQYDSNNTIDYLLDFSDNYVNRTNSCTVKVKRFKGIDNFFDNANGLSFEQVDFLPSDFVDIDYVIIKPDQLTYFISLGLSTYVLTEALIEAAKQLKETIRDIQKAAIPNGFLPNLPDILGLAIMLAARIAYTLAIVIALIKLVQEILNIIFPKIRQFQGITYKKLIEKGCQKLGYTLQSTLLDSLSKLTICPVPLKEKDPSIFKSLFAPLSLAYTKGHPSSRDVIPSLGSSITALENIFHAKTRVVNGVVTIEKESYYENNAGQAINDTFINQAQIIDENLINSDEIFKRLTCAYAVDALDINTFDDTKLSVYEVSSEVQTSIGFDYNLIKGSDVINIPFARGTRKGSLTFVEKAAKTLAQAVDLFTGSSLATQIEARKNVMIVSEQYFGVTKLLWMNGTKLDQNQTDYIGADKIINNYHIDRFIQNNQKEVFQGMQIAINQSELFNIIANNYVNLSNGDLVEIRRIVWNEKQNQATIDFTKKVSSINETTIVINNGL